jgi:hypothetical protein
MRKSAVAKPRRQLIEVERQLEEIAKVSPPDKALRLRQAIDLLTEGAPLNSTDCADC